MHRNVILSMTDVVHLSRQKRLLVLLRIFAAKAAGSFLFLFLEFRNLVCIHLGGWIASSLLLTLYDAKCVVLIQRNGKLLCVSEYFPWVS